MKRARELWHRWLRALRPERHRPPVARDHPSVEMLAAYQEDRLPPEEDGEIQEHFVACEECPELMLDLDRFQTPEAVEAAQAALPSSWVDAAWRRLRARLAVEVRPPRQVERWFRKPMLAWALTACLVPCTLVLWLRLDALQQEARDLDAPQLNPPLLNVEPELLLQRGGDSSPLCEVEVPADASRFLLVLTPSEMVPHRAEYHLAIRTWEGDALWEQGGLLPAPEGTFVVALSRRFLPAGAYRFQVTGGQQDQGPYQEEFQLRVTYL